MSGACATPTPALLLLLGGAGWSVWAAGEMRAGYAAKTLDTCVFVAGREAASCLTEKLGARMVRFDRLAALFSD